jgi:hypothetical protein
MFFCQDKRASTKAEHPSSSFAELGKILGDLWQKLDEEEKKPYMKQNEQDKARYAKEKEQFPDEDGDDDGGGKKKKAKTGKRKKDKDAPKNAKSAYMFFCGEERKRLKDADASLTFSQIGTQMGANWKALSDEQKQPYIEMNKEAKKKADANKAAYEAEHGKPEKAAKKGKKAKKEAAEEEGDDAGGDNDGDDE